MSQGIKVREIKPKGIVVTRKIAKGQVATSHWDQTSSAEDAIDRAVVASAVGAGGRELIGRMTTENHIVHAMFVKDGGDLVTCDLVIEITPNEDLVASINPLGESLVQILQECGAGTSVIIMIIKVLHMLSIYPSRSSFDLAIGQEFRFTRTVHAHDSQHQTIAALKAGPAPAAQPRLILASAAGILANLAIGQYRGAPPLGAGADTRVFIVCCEGFANLRFEIFLGDVHKLLVAREVRPLEPTLLEHGDGRFEPCKGSEEFIILRIVIRGREAVGVQTQSSDDVRGRGDGEVSMEG